MIIICSNIFPPEFFCESIKSFYEVSERFIVLVKVGEPVRRKKFTKNSQGGKEVNHQTMEHSPTKLF